MVYGDSQLYIRNYNRKLYKSLILRNYNLLIRFNYNHCIDVLRFDKTHHFMLTYNELLHVEEEPRIFLFKDFLFD